VVKLKLAKPFLCDLHTGKVLSKKSMMNPQVRYGEDVLSRISYAMMEDNGLEKMHNTMIESINTLVQKMTEEVGLISTDVQKIVLVFNTVMHHIALNIDPKFMGRSPFASAIKQSLDIKARDLKIEINPCGNIHVLPIEAGFVGADNMAVLIAEEPYNHEEMRLIIVRKGTDGKMEYVICWANETSIGQDISITIGDVRAVQLAKSALYVGAKCLMEKLGIEKVDSVTLAGAFGSFIDSENAMIIGMFPNCELDKVIAVGNAAGDGAQITLLNKEKRVEADRVAKDVFFVETAVELDFQQRFSDAMAFPHSHDSFPSIQHILDRIPKRGR